MVYYKFGRCTVCQFRLRPDNVFTLKNCNHRECVTRWITEGSKTCPRCRDPATLNDIKQLFVEEAGDSSDDSGDELIQSSSNLSTKNENVNY
uniref:RING-type domain-containing protein n=1 Tax=Meloidogyne incognita TaxID=6306 RepID=A0A914M1J0_MELIC